MNPDTIFSIGFGMAAASVAYFLSKYLEAQIKRQKIRFRLWEIERAIYDAAKRK